MLIKQFMAVGISAFFACAAAATGLPPSFQDALKKAKIPETAVSVMVQEIGQKEPLITHLEQTLRNPASVMKVVTTTAGLDLLGTQYQWKTEVYLDGILTADGTLQGNLILKGYGDPKITIEQWQDFMQQLVASGVKKITGDLWMDRSVFSLPKFSPAAFDGEPIKPYNVGPDALLLTFKSVRLQIIPNLDKKAKFATVLVEPPLASVRVTKAPKQTNQRCGDGWASSRPKIQELGKETLLQFGGKYSSRCGVSEKYLAVLDAPHFIHDMFAYYYREAGGDFKGGFKEITAPTNKTPYLTFHSLPLSNIVYDINKRSNNVMAQQLFLALSSQKNSPPYSYETSRAVVNDWIKTRALHVPGLLVENGSGLSRLERISAEGLVSLLLFAEKSPWFDAFYESLPVAGVDGTLKRRFGRSAAKERARMKSGYLNNVRALAGYIEDVNGKHYVAVILLNHKNAKGAAQMMEFFVNEIAKGTV
ncbi:MAG: D-alanyl-D-alanine carboxypeptidase/D-alanyl-D-alanine-endopeptidase [Burkholderiales bacterium]|jgi:D-alanyl-D-alanine carboxypeptidase/D-alanyl-D-alanine-endopeptidase (penicillin-binding protein 4)|nr:D-alanyl-D-alanine carboxypeptidase/D-alanyl-D-alanine-endopeptidase [Burkholderiales bacterium]